MKNAIAFLLASGAMILALWVFRGPIFGIGLLLWLIVCPASKGAVVSMWESTGSPLVVRVTQYDEQCGGFVPGAYYLFECVRPYGATTTVFEFRHDDPVPIPTNQIRFIGNDIAYCYMGWKYAVTTDGGTQWAVWDATHHDAYRHMGNYNLIRSVSIDAAGAGSMLLQYVGPSGEQAVRLETNDFGATWSVAS